MDVPAQRLLERKLEIDLLLALAADVAGGQSRLAVVTGEAGIGKSRLCHEVLTVLPDDWPRHVHHRTGPGRPPDGPAAIVVEDLHDADPDTPEQLRDLLADGPPVLVLCTYRLGSARQPTAPADGALQLLRIPGTVEVRLAPLSSDATEELARDLGARLDDDDLERLHERTGGNPFFIEELIRAGEAGMPWTVTASVMNRVESLSDPARRGLEVLAVAGPWVERLVLDRLVGGTSPVAVELVDRLLAVTTDRSVRLRHDIVGEVVAERLSDARVRAVHGDVAAALVDEGVAAHRIAHHLVAAGETDEALRWAERAAHEAVEERRFARATRWYRLVIDDADRERPGGLLHQAATAAALAGRTELAERWAQQADAAYRAAGATHLATAMWLDQSLAYIRRPAIDLDELAPDAVRRLAADATASARAGSFDTARSIGTRALAAAIEQGDSDAGGVAALALLLAGAPAEALDGLERLRREAMVADDLVHEARRTLDMARCAASLGDLVSSEDHQRAGLDVLRRLPESGEEPMVVCGLAAILATAGDLDAAEDLATPLLEHPSRAVATVAYLPLIIVDLARGRLDRVRPWLAALAPFRDIAGPEMFSIVGAQEALLHLRGGDLGRAAGALRDLEEWVGGAFDMSKPDRLELTARTAYLRGDVPTLEQVCSEAARLSRHREAGPGILGLAELTAGLRAMHRGRPSLALVHLEAGARLLADAPRRVQAADAWCDAALAAVEAAEDGRARAALDNAVTTADTLGLEPVRARVGSILATMGRADTTADEGDLARLTPRERSVLALVADGLTNKQIAAELHLAEKTVRNQLSLLFAKLGIQRRSQAAVFAVRHGLVDEDRTG